jgi:hypothetical protein
MLTRTKRVTLTFQHAFSLEGVDRSLAAGDYEVVTDEELIVDPNDLAAAHQRDQALATRASTVEPRTP